MKILHQKNNEMEMAFRQIIKTHCGNVRPLVAMKCNVSALTMDGSWIKLGLVTTPAPNALYGAMKKSKLFQKILIEIV